MTAEISHVKPYKGMGMNGGIARWYAKLTRKSLDDFRALAERVAATLPTGSSVLEVAPGPGYFAIELARMGEYRIAGLDISETFVEIARANAAKARVQIDFRLGNAARMPFGDETFDFLLCRAAFKNFSEPERAMEEMYRVLKPGGRALIIDLRRDASREAVARQVDGMHLGAVNRLLTKLTFRTMLLNRAYTQDEFEEFAAGTMFQGIEIRQDLTTLEIGLSK